MPTTISAMTDYPAACQAIATAVFDHMMKTQDLRPIEVCGVRLNCSQEKGQMTRSLINGLRAVQFADIDAALESILEGVCHA